MQGGRSTADQVDQEQVWKFGANGSIRIDQQFDLLSRRRAPIPLRRAGGHRHGARLAGYKYDEIVNVSKCIISCIHVLHENGVVHGDIKERNVLRLPSADDKPAKWILCDLDASAPIGAPVGLKSSDAYSPPELAQSKYSTKCSTNAVISIYIYVYELRRFEGTSARSLSLPPLACRFSTPRARTPTRTPETRAPVLAGVCWWAVEGGRERENVGYQPQAFQELERSETGVGPSD
eukprot:COSAG02_NODE_1051_length_14956_cov_3.414216_18_plen_234_part_01